MNPPEILSPSYSPSIPELDALRVVRHVSVLLTHLMYFLGAPPNHFKM